MTTDQKRDTLLWFVEKVKETPDAQMWLASSGSIITGTPIDSTEYYQIIFQSSEMAATSDTENILALKDVEFRMAQFHATMNLALVDINLIVSWGLYDPDTTFRWDPAPRL